MGSYCRDNLLFPFTFAGVNNYLEVPGYPRSNSLFVRFDFRTWDFVGLLLYTPFADDLGWLEMVLSDGQVNVTIAQPRSETKAKKLEFAAGTNEEGGRSRALPGARPSSLPTLQREGSPGGLVELHLGLHPETEPGKLLEALVINSHPQCPQVG